MYCNNCGKEISEETNYCPYCGAEVTKAKTVSHKKLLFKNSKFYLLLLILFLLIFLGSFFLFNFSNKNNNIAQPVKSENNELDSSVPISPGIHNYEFVSSFDSFNDAVRAAKEKNGYLLHIDTPEEYNLINEKLEEQYQNGSRTIEYYIGGKRFADTGYKWIDQDGNLYGEIINNINFWYPGEPSFLDPKNKKVKESVLCIMRDSGQWLVNDVVEDIDPLYEDFNGKLGYIIEYE